MKIYSLLLQQPATYMKSVAAYMKKENVFSKATPPVTAQILHECHISD